MLSYKTLVLVPVFHYQILSLTALILKAFTVLHFFRVCACIVFSIRWLPLKTIRALTKTVFKYASSVHEHNNSPVEINDDPNVLVNKPIFVLSYPVGFPGLKNQNQPMDNLDFFKINLRTLYSEKFLSIGFPCPCKCPFMEYCVMKSQTQHMFLLFCCQCIMILYL